METIGIIGFIWGIYWGYNDMRGYMGIMENINLREAWVSSFDIQSFSELSHSRTRSPPFTRVMLTSMVTAITITIITTNIIMQSEATPRGPKALNLFA